MAYWLARSFQAKVLGCFGLGGLPPKGCGGEAGFPEKRRKLTSLWRSLIAHARTGYTRELLRQVILNTGIRAVFSEIENSFITDSVCDHCKIDCRRFAKRYPASIMRSSAVLSDRQKLKHFETRASIQDNIHQDRFVGENILPIHRRKNPDSFWRVLVSDSRGNVRRRETHVHFSV